MEHGTTRIASAKLLAIALGGAAAGCGGAGPQKSAALSPATQPTTTVSVETIQPQKLSLRIPVVGTLFAAEEVTISTKAAGVLRRTFVDVGAVVTPGDSLTQVDTIDYDVAVRQARAALAAALARLGVGDVPDATFDLTQVSTVQRAAAQVASARFTHDRLAALNAGGMSPVSEQEMNDAETALRVAEAEHRLAVDEAAALVATARERQSQVQMSEQRQSDALTLTPPIPTTLGREGATSWVVSARLVTEGQFVNAGNPLYRLLIRDPLKLRSKVPERYAADVRVGQVVRLQIVGAAAAPVGRIIRVSPSVDPASRTFEIEALVDNHDSAHMPGAFATGTIEAESPAALLLIPGEAIQRAGGATTVFVLENGVARARSVQLGRANGNQIEVVAGLRAGEKLIVGGAATLADGDAVALRAAP